MKKTKVTLAKLQKEIDGIHNKVAALTNIDTKFVGVEKFSELLALSVVKKVSNLIDQYLGIEERGDVGANRSKSDLS